MARKTKVIQPEVLAPAAPEAGTFDPHSSTHVVCNQFSMPYCCEISQLQDPETFQYGELWYGTEAACKAHVAKLQEKKRAELLASGQRRIQQFVPQN